MSIETHTGGAAATRPESHPETRAPEAAATHHGAQAPMASRARPVLPPVDILEDETGITLVADMPGVRREDLVLQVEGDVLSIEGEARLDLPADLVPLYDELPGHRYARSFTLSRELDPSGIKADVDRGVLRLHIPKAEASKPRKIEVSLG